MPVRLGTNFQDRNDIKRYVEQGETNADLIAANLKISKEPVQKYIDSLTKKPKPKRGPKPKEPELPPAGDSDDDNPE